MNSTGVILTQVINYILDAGNIEFLRKYSITEDYFPGYLDEYYFIVDHYEKYNKTPDKLTFVAEFPNFSVFQVTETEEYLYSTLHSFYVYQKFSADWAELIPILNEDPMLGLDRLKIVIDQYPTIGGTAGINIIANALDRLKLLQEHGNTERSYHIKTGFPELDTVLTGWTRGEDFIVFFGRTGQGKEQPLSSKILTPTGWITMGDVLIGTQLFAKNGDRCKVIGIFDQGEKDVYQLKFSDGTIAECGLDHLWEVQDRKNRKYGTNQVITLRKMIQNFKSEKYSVNCINELSYDSAFSFPLTDAYFYGMKLAYKVLSSKITNIDIPSQFLYSPLWVRSELLRGICDNLECYYKSNGAIRVKCVDAKFKHDFMNLLRSFGAKVWERRNKYIYFFIPRNPFKYDVYNYGKHNCKKNELKKYIISIQKIRKEQCRCIMVDHPSHTYITDNYTITHNSWVMQKSLASACLSGNKVGLISPEMSAYKVGYRIDSLLNGFSNTDLNTARIMGKEEDFKRYQQYIEETSKSSNCFVVAGMQDFSKHLTISKLRNFIVSHKLDIVGIDGITYMEDERRKRNDNKTIMLTNISEDLIGLSNELQIPIIVAVQSNRGGIRNEEEDGNPDLGSIRDSDGISHNSTKVISIRQHNDMLHLQVVKHRDGKTGDRFSYYWNADVGEFRFENAEGERRSYREMPESVQTNRNDQERSNNSKTARGRQLNGPRKNIEAYDNNRESRRSHRPDNVRDF